ncbi:MAG: hypothetical protein NTX79_05310 [Candidatus Micrarchaeota archaeon]|nr:hypothetical protein [Candidatus Micrarchaeota archaeon]
MSSSAKGNGRRAGRRRQLLPAFFPCVLAFAALAGAGPGVAFTALEWFSPACAKRGFKNYFAAVMPFSWENNP